MSVAYAKLERHWSRLHRFSTSTRSRLDRTTMMPPEGKDARAAALAEMDGLPHSLRTEPQLPGLLDTAAAEPLDDAASANLREIRRDWTRSNALPPRLVEALPLAASRCKRARREQRDVGDWAGFAVDLREVVGLVREQAECLADASGLGRHRLDE